MSGEADLEIGLPDARARFANLARAGWLLRAAQEAYGTGASLAKSGAAGSAWGMSRLVKVHVRDQAPPDDPAAYLPHRWEAIGPGGEPFAALDADITLTPSGDHATTLALAAVYRPPPGSHGNGDDRATVQVVAATTIRVFLDRIAEGVCGPGPADERDDEAAGGGGSWPPAARAP